MESIPRDWYELGANPFMQDDTSPKKFRREKPKAKKGKVVAKSTGLTYQFQIMESIGVPRAEIKKFADPQYWLHFFPPIAKASLSHRYDFRRENNMKLCRRTTTRLARA